MNRLYNKQMACILKGSDEKMAGNEQFHLDESKINELYHWIWASRGKKKMDV